MSQATQKLARSQAWRRVTHGAYVPVTMTDDRAVLRVWRDALPSETSFTHLTSALLRGWQLPAPLPFQPVFAALSCTCALPRRAGLRASRPLTLEPATQLAGLPVAGPTDTLVACARDLGLLDLVVLIDAAVHAGHCTIPDIEAACRPRRRGAPALRRAVRYADPRAESPWESMLRMLHVLCGIRVESQFPVGSYRADLRITGTQRLPEYDGSHHRAGPQHARDLIRERALQREGWQRFGYTSSVMVRDARSVLRDADQALGHKHDPMAARPWFAALANSCVTTTGRQRLRRRWAPAIDV
ncbi:MAG: endonuclease domain-containing protein [Geodermatophilaceae bacterium]